MPRHHRRRPPPPPSFFGRIVDAIKRNPIKFWMTVGGALAVIVPAVKGIQYLDEVTDPWQPASHPFVYKHVGDVDKKAEAIGTQNQTILRELQIDTARGKREATLNDIKKWQLELEKPGVDQTLKGFIQQQIDTLAATRDKLDAQIKTLTAIKGQ
jgi:hypothetical protein